MIDIVFIIFQNNNVQTQSYTQKVFKNSFWCTAGSSGAAQILVQTLLRASWKKPSDEVFQENMEALERQVQC